MKLYCQVCNNLLEVVIKDDVMKFRCESCASEYDPEPDDTLRYEEEKGSDISIFAGILKNITKDPVNPKVRRQCKKCNHGIAKYVQLGDDKKIVYGCLGCNEISF